LRDVDLADDDTGGMNTRTAQNHADQTSERSGLGSVRKALDVLEFVAQSESSVGMSETARALGLAKSTTYRLLTALRDRGYVRQMTSTGRYLIGVKAFEVGSGFLTQTDLRSASYPEMERLLQETEETVHLAVLDGFDVVYVEKIVSPRPFSVNSEVGRRSPAYCTAVGKAMLAQQDMASIDRWLQAPLPALTLSTISDPADLKRELANVRQAGFATDSEESEVGLCCLAAPIFDHSGHVVAAIGIAAPKLRMVPSQDLYQSQVLTSAQRISTLLGLPASAGRSS